jgi:hypothetical protein
MRAPTNLVAPELSGTATDGTELTTTLGDWDGTEPLAHAITWQRCDAALATCTDIAGATDATYTLTGADVGHRVRSRVKASNLAGEAWEPSLATAAVDPLAPHNTLLPPVIGTARDGEVLTATPGTWDGTAPIEYAYQWQRCDAGGTGCVDIEGADEATYELVSDDAGHAIRVVVTATNAGGTDTASSLITPVVAPQAPANVIVPSFPGTPEKGTPLQATTGDWDGTLPVEFTYQWERCDANGEHCEAIPGATGPTYTPTADDAEHTIRVAITATNEAGTTTAHSRPSGMVAANPKPPVVQEETCTQLAGGAKYRRVKVGGIGHVRVRAYTSGTATTSSPVQVTTTIVGGRARSVRYLLDGRPLAAAAKGSHDAMITPAQLGAPGRHVLTTTVRGRRGAKRTIKLTLTTVSCATLFAAQRWRTTAGYGLRLRLDARTALDAVSFAVPRALLPKRLASGRPAGFLRLYVGGRPAPVRYELAVPRRGAAPVLLAGADRPAVRLTRRGLRLSGLPAGTAVAELTLYRVSRLDGATTRKRLPIAASVQGAGAVAQTFVARPRAPR